ncbi:hypothetical protein LY474_07470 [Myxococcus stipitatus]|uniref:hypothetical protein n=1 Tax=Myxococcus stipitatus TaxID=83455 RepID=UPI001F19E939|nr:hypothetical protein [Myxococcus stipitatus]MCE9667653.1 hypothetical protein [Myxococcus stipitatus]
MLSLIAVWLLTSTPVPARQPPPQQQTQPSTPPVVEVVPPRPECVDSNGRTVCGFQCRTIGPHTACAQTPYGVCQVLVGRVYCWDPPRVAIDHPPGGVSRRPECKESRGQVACGFNCRVFNGEVRCNSTQYGVCDTHFNQLVCWDPPDSVIHERGGDTPRPSCLDASEAIACGYDCKALRTEVRCASTPQGRCVQNNDELTCFDPPSLLHCDHSAPPPPPR